jgi:hypothetical protein
MSTNYYILTKDKSIIEKYELSYELTDTPDWGYISHIAKRSCGWKPLFQGHGKINRIDDIYNLINEPTVIILDEYDKALSPKEFEKEVIQWSKNDKEALSHIQEQQKDTYTNARRYYYLDSSKLWADDKGYEFMSLDFA